LEVQRKVVENLGAKEADIFEAHLLMLEDQRPGGRSHPNLIKEEKVNAEYRLSHRGRALFRRAARGQ
jgi:phosphotransferase system enzyme I (PtsI)